MPFTYHYMPVNQLGAPARSPTATSAGRTTSTCATTPGYASDGAYTWRFDRELAGSGVIGDLASHWIHLARWMLDDTRGLGRRRSPRRSSPASRAPTASAYEQAEDSAVLTVRYASGAYGVLQVSAVCWEGTPFGQTHHLEVHGDAGTIYATCDWDTVQEVRGVRRGERRAGRRCCRSPTTSGAACGATTCTTPTATCSARTDAMTRGWISAITEGRHVRPDFGDGLAVQRVVDAAVASAAGDGGARSPINRG